MHLHVSARAPLRHSDQRMAASRTAEYVALYRALETTERRREPLFRDPFAARFLTGSRAAWFALAGVPGMRSLIERYADRRAPGARSSAIARTRFVDDFVRAEIQRGIRQLVILGAGYDARAHRIDDLMATGSEVFEVDQPDTQKAKRKRLEGATGLKPNVRYVPCDFEQQHLPTQLADAGWEADHRSIFVWEGVTNYLDEAAVVAVLDTVSRTKPGSVIAFSYIHKGVIDGSEKFEGADKLVENVRRLGEPWKFGLRPDELPRFLAAFEMKLEQDVGTTEYRDKYLGYDIGYGFYRIAIARVNARSRPPTGS